MTQEALKMALDALEATSPLGFGTASDKRHYGAITAIKEALAQPEQEPVAWYVKSKEGEPLLGSEPSFYLEEAEEILAGQIEDSGSEIAPLYPHPQRTWVDLTRTQMQDVYFAVLEEHRGGHQMEGQLAFGEALQAKIKERNT